MSLHVKKGDNVVVIAGKDKGKTGKVLTAVPADNAVTLPDWSTIATWGLLLSHIISFIVALDGLIEAESIVVEPLTNSIDELFSLIEETNVSIFVIFENRPHTSST